MIAPALNSDLDDVARMMADAPLLQRYQVTFVGARASLAAALDGGDLVLCSRAGPTLQGFAWLSFAAHMLNGAAYLRLLLVASPGWGLGTDLLVSAEATARTRANHLYLLATTDNLGARRFYERHGYRHVGDLPGLVWPHLAEALYHKPLRDYAERLSE